MKILSKQDFNQNESKNFVVDNLSSAPSNPVLGQIYYNTQEERAYICIKAGETPEWADLTLNVIDSLDGNSTTNAPSVRAVNEGLGNTINEVNSKFNYSTEEQVIGTWIDGKPLYRKVIFLNSLPNNDNVKSYNHNISDVDIIYFDKCFAIWNYGQSNQFINQLPFFNYAGSHIYLFDADRTGFKIKTTIDRTSLKGFITLEYTKTTD